MMSSIIRWLAVTTLIGQIGNAPAGVLYQTGFESADGFSTGILSMATAPGWGKYTNSDYQPTIADSNAATGGQHLRISADSEAGQANTGGFSPDLGPLSGTDDYYLSLDFAIGDIGGANYDVIMQAPSQDTFSARVTLSADGDILVFDDAGAGLARVDSGADWTAGIYHSLEIMLLNSINQIHYLLDGSLFYKSVAGVFAGTAFEQAVLMSNNAQNGESADFDNLVIRDDMPAADPVTRNASLAASAVPAPATVALFALGLIGLRYQRARQSC